MITYLFGASPIAEQGFFDQEVPEPVRSFRNSDHGYVNKEEIQVSFVSLEDMSQPLKPISNKEI